MGGERPGLKHLGGGNSGIVAAGRQRFRAKHQAQSGRRPTWRAFETVKLWKTSPSPPTSFPWQMFQNRPPGAGRAMPGLRRAVALCVECHESSQPHPPQTSPPNPNTRFSPPTPLTCPPDPHKDRASEQIGPESGACPGEKRCRSALSNPRTSSASGVTGSAHAWPRKRVARSSTPAVCAAGKA